LRGAGALPAPGRCGRRRHRRAVRRGARRDPRSRPGDAAPGAGRRRGRAGRRRLARTEGGRPRDRRAAGLAHPEGNDGPAAGARGPARRRHRSRARVRLRARLSGPAAPERKLQMDNTSTSLDTPSPLARDDLDDVVAIDAAWEGRSRRLYFERRLAAALREPALHAQFAVRDGRGLAGYLLARVLEGEFGHRDRSLRLESIGVRADARGRGVGRTLFAGLEGWA